MFIFPLLCKPCIGQGGTPPGNESRLCPRYLRWWSRYNARRRVNPAKTGLSMNREEAPRSQVARILTDMHFWVPVAVLFAGLLLLKLIH